MLKLSKVVATLLVAISALALNQVSANAEWVQKYTNPPLFWYKEGDSWATGWRYIDNQWYYLDPDTGYAYTGWHYIDGKWYFFRGIRGMMAQNLITPYYYEDEKGIYYLNSNGVYIDNPPEEIQAYIDLMKDRSLLIKLKIIDSGTREFGAVDWGGTSDIRPDGVVYDDVSDNNKDGIFEMYTSSSFGKKCTVKYNDRKIYVYDDSNNLISSTETIANANSTTATKNFVNQLGFRVNVSSGQIVSYTGNDASLDIPSTINGVNVTSIGVQAFGGNNTLTSVIIPNSITNIGDQAFGLCTNLKSITIPSSVTSIGQYVFLGCDNLMFNVESEQTKTLLISSGVDASKITLKN